MAPHQLQEISLSFRGYTSLKSGRRHDRYIDYQGVLGMVQLAYDTLPVRELHIYGKDGKEYRTAKRWPLRAIRIILDEPLSITYSKEYERIYRPICDYLWSVGHYPHNMWGYGPEGMWQMDGRHAGKDERQGHPIL